MMMIDLLDANPRVLAEKTFHSAQMSGFCCMFLAKYLTCLLLLQYNS